MSVDHYAAVLADLRAKHTALGELIAALENVQRLDAPLPVSLPNTATPPTDEVRPFVMRVPATERRHSKLERTASRASLPGGRARRSPGAWDEPCIAAIGSTAMTGLEVAKAVGGVQSTIHNVLQRLVTKGRLTRVGDTYRADVPAKEEV